MKKFAVWVAAALCFVSSCRKSAPEPEKNFGSIRVNVSCSAIKGSAKSFFETRIEFMSCLLFKDDILIQSFSTEEITDMYFPFLPAGNYKIVVITSDMPRIEAGMSYNALAEGRHYLYAGTNGYSSGFNMFGQMDLTLEPSEEEYAEVVLGHCCAKISIRNLYADYSGVLGEMGVSSIKPDKVFIMDAYSACHVNGKAVMARDWGLNGVESVNRWNGTAMAFASDPAVRAVTSYDYSGADGFQPLYVCPTFGSDVTTIPYLVLQTTATFRNGDSKVWYYRTPLGGPVRMVQADNDYFFSLVIKSPGADSPDRDSPGFLVNDQEEDGDPQSDIY